MSKWNNVDENEFKRFMKSPHSILELYGIARRSNEHGGITRRKFSRVITDLKSLGNMLYEGNILRALSDNMTIWKDVVIPRNRKITDNRVMLDRLFCLDELSNIVDSISSVTYGQVRRIIDVSLPVLNGTYSLKVDGKYKLFTTLLVSDIDENDLLSYMNKTSFKNKNPPDYNLDNNLVRFFYAGQTIYFAIASTNEEFFSEVTDFCKTEKSFNDYGVSCVKNMFVKPIPMMVNQVMSKKFAKSLEEYFLGEGYFVVVDRDLCKNKYRKNPRAKIIESLSSWYSK